MMAGPVPRVVALLLMKMEVGAVQMAPAAIEVAAARLAAAQVLRFLRRESSLLTVQAGWLMCGDLRWSNATSLACTIRRRAELLSDGLRQLGP
jgi:hypothetical protein